MGDSEDDFLLKSIISKKYYASHRRQQINFVVIDEYLHTYEKLIIVRLVRGLTL
jgi:hypothetical protein